MVLLDVKKTISVGACSIEILPDEVLCFILSRLTLKEAARISVLSSRWRYLWRFASCDFVFQLDQKDAENTCLVKTTEFVNSVSQVMALHQAPNVDKLIIRFSTLSHVRDIPICEWIHFVMQKKIRVFELASFGHHVPRRVWLNHFYPLDVHRRVWLNHFYPLDQDAFSRRYLPAIPELASLYYDFPHLEKFLSISRAMEAENCFVSLTSFTLVSFNINDDMMNYLLSNCPCLEQLSLKGGACLSNLNIDTPSLKSLSVCSCWDLKTLKICAVNLVSFEYMGLPPCLLRCPDFYFQNVPLLSEIKMDMSYLLSFVRRKHLHEVYSNQLEKLVMYMSSEDMDYYCPMTFSNCQILPGLRCLRQLELIIRTTPGANLKFYLLLIRACPFLSTVFVQFYDEDMPDPEKKRLGIFSAGLSDLKWRVNRYCHKHIKVVRLIDFVNDKSYIEFAMQLARMCKSLEKLIIKPKSDTHRVAIIESGAKQLLESNLPARAEMVMDTPAI